MLEKVKVERGMSIVMIRCHYDTKTSTVYFIRKNYDRIRKTNVIPVNTNRNGFIVINH
jgi:hypothetical protein